MLRENGGRQLNVKEVLEVRRTLNSDGAPNVPIQNRNGEDSTIIYIYASCSNVIISNVKHANVYGMACSSMKKCS